jgi:hypothetical protein
MTINHPRSVLALGAALALTGGFAVEAASASAQTVNAVQQARASANWAGYVASGQNFSSVSGSWIQPAVNANSNDGYSAFWVGLGGAGQQSQALEQVGTSADVQNGQTTYYAWYELVPNPETKLNLAVNPGDHMTGNVTVNGTTVTISLIDQTTGKSVTKTLQDRNPDTSSAEWIAEAPSSQTPDGGYQPLPLADFGKVTFTNATATAGGHTGSIDDSAWSTQPVELSPSSSAGVLGAGGRINAVGAGGQSSSGGASPSNLTGDGSSFSVSYSTDGGGYGGAGGYADSPYPGYGYGGYGGAGGYGYGGDPGISLYGY